MIDEKKRVVCDNCGQTLLEVGIGIRNHHFCDQSCRNFWEATHDPSTKVAESTAAPTNDLFRE